MDDFEDNGKLNIEDEISDPLIRVSDVERILLKSGLVPRHQVPLIIEKLRDEAHGDAFAIDDEIDFDSDDFDPETETLL